LTDIKRPQIGQPYQKAWFLINDDVNGAHDVRRSPQVIGMSGEHAAREE
jgi:hypothetical protein